MHWPTVITPTSGRWRLLGATRSGGCTLVGTKQVIVTAGAKWRAALMLPLVRSGMND